MKRGPSNLQQEVASLMACYVRKHFKVELEQLEETKRVIMDDSRVHYECRTCHIPYTIPRLYGCPCTIPHACGREWCSEKKWYRCACKRPMCGECLVECSTSDCQATVCNSCIKRCAHCKNAHCAAHSSGTKLCNSCFDQEVKERNQGIHV
jgi:hypothetical protein